MQSTITTVWSLAEAINKGSGTDQEKFDEFYRLLEGHSDPAMQPFIEWLSNILKIPVDRRPTHPELTLLNTEFRKHWICNCGAEIPFVWKTIPILRITCVVGNYPQWGMLVPDLSGDYYIEESARLLPDLPNDAELDLVLRGCTGLTDLPALPNVKN